MLRRARPSSSKRRLESTEQPLAEQPANANADGFTLFAKDGGSGSGRLWSPLMGLTNAGFQQWEDEGMPPSPSSFS